MRPARPVPSELASGPFSRATALAHVTDRTLGGPAYRSLTRGVHAARELPVDHGVRILAARAALGEHAVVSGASAAWVWGAQLAAPDEPATMTVSRHVRQRRELRVREDVLRAGEVVVTARWGLTTTPARTAYDLGRVRSLTTAVQHLDALTATTRVTPDDVLACTAGRPGSRWITTLRTALELTDPGAESPRESALRVLLVTAGLPRPATQVVVRDVAGFFVARVDLGWPDLRVAVEYDGQHHDLPEQVRKDRARLNRPRVAGWTVIVVDRHQMRRPDDVVATVAAALRAARGR
ncbi:hypothetical protein [Luteimicrobium subarcticum]|uniref:Transcriptional regulator with AbiEi antitoxin domain of type IV toxin-antitoxin system n=1 Tax=Luteimicrobium subarcticum TaxID=620910 RepID=A0A2M8WVY2_9MICO|nr:hypothetical protein [Luteimicrobium subarcticum]PJI95076.1 transcriptional regulator with AbiEi antitoxin domain of type IV toxin-antitoxin system [Luteimicrobium subarcticum]